MKKNNLNCHFGSGITAVYKTVVMVVFAAILLNLINLGVFRGIHISVPQAETGLGKIYGCLNLPMKIVGDLFNGKGLSQKEKADSEKKHMALIPLNTGRVSNEILKKEMSMLSGWDIYGKNFIPYYYADIERARLFDNSAGSGAIRILLLILILMALLPRGISVNVIKQNSMKFTFPDFIFNKVGFFYFMMNVRGV